MVKASPIPDGHTGGHVDSALEGLGDEVKVEWSGHPLLVHVEHLCAKVEVQQDRGTKGRPFRSE